MDNALIILRRYTRGEFDAEIATYQKMVADGEPLDQKTLTAMQRGGQPIQVGLQRPGASCSTPTAQLLQLRCLTCSGRSKVGQAPKTINFTGNLIGYGNEATIDVWAAGICVTQLACRASRHQLKRLWPANTLTGSDMDNPRIGGEEFGFGQRGFADAAQRINSSGMIKEVNADLGELGADDLQAVIWFLEKEKWTNNGWTSKTGEGGSLNYESVYGGSPDRARVARSIINKKGSTP